MKQLLFFVLCGSLLFFQSCRTDSVDPCDGVSCLNNGTCNDGSCDCAAGYAGTDCGTPIPSTKMTITKITLKSYPIQNGSGQTWDSSDNADVFVSFNVGNNPSTGAGYASEVKENAGDGTSLVFTQNLPTATSTNAHGVLWTLGVWDDEGAGNTAELMGSIEFVPKDYDAGYPASIEVTQGDFTAVLEVTWEP